VYQPATTWTVTAPKKAGPLQFAWH